MSIALAAAQLRMPVTKSRANGLVNSSETRFAFLLEREPIMTW
jgi:hypothetical protein